MRHVAIIGLAALAILWCLTGCQSQSYYRTTDGTEVYSTTDVMYKSDGKVQAWGEGQVRVRTYDTEGNLTADVDVDNTSEDSMVNVVINGDGNKTIGSLLWSAVAGDLINQGANVAEDGVSQ